MFKINFSYILIKQIAYQHTEIETFLKNSSKNFRDILLRNYDLGLRNLRYSLVTKTKETANPFFPSSLTFENGFLILSGHNQGQCLLLVSRTDSTCA